MLKRAGVQHLPQTIGSDVLVVGHAKLSLESRVRSGADWFFWVAALSMADAIVVLTIGFRRLMFGFGTAKALPLAVRGHETTGEIAGYVATLLLAGALLLLGTFARKGRRWAFVAGLILYAVDTAALVPLADIASIAFHALAIYAIARGFTALSRLEALDEAERAAHVAH